MNSRRLFNLVMAFMIALSMAGVPTQASAQIPAWESLSSMPMPRMYLTAASVEGNLYVIGGQDITGVLNSVEEYDPATDLWNSKSLMPTERGYLGSGTLNGLIYAVGGWNFSSSPGFLNTVEAYNPLTNTWEARAPLIYSRGDPGVVGLDGLLYVVGGRTEGGGCGFAYNSMEVYDPITNSWYMLPSMPTARWSPAIAAVNGLIYVIGGWANDCSALLTVVEAYDPATQTWSTKSPMPTSRAHMAYGTIRGRILVAGGQGQSHGLDVLEIYDPIADTWNTAEPMPTARGVLAGATIGDTFFAVGGAYTPGVDILSTLEAYQYSPINRAPTAEASGPYTASVNQPITLDASASFDPDGDTLSYWWDLDNDGVYDDLGGPTPFTAFNQTGEFTIALQVSDVFGMTSTDTATVTVTTPVSNNSIFVAPVPNGLHAWDWPDGAWVTLTIDDLHTWQSPDYSETKQASYSAPWAPQNTLVEFVNGAYDIKAGDVITVSDGITTKTHITTGLTVDQFDLNADTIAGRAEPGSTVTVVRVCDASRCSERTVTTDPSGRWVAEFGIPGDINHPETIDIRGGTDGIAYQYDGDGDATQINWRVPNPRIFVVDSHYSNCCAYNVVGGEEWEPGKTISLSIDNPSNGAGWDYQDSLVALDGQYGWANSQWTFNIDPQEFSIEPGYLVQVTDGTTVKEHVVKDLVITDVDLDADTVEGQSNSDEQLYVPVMVDDQYVERFVSPAINGHWIADFGHPGEQGNEQAIIDLTPDTMVIPEQADEDGDSTKLWWQLPNPYFFVDFAGSHVYAFQWPVDAMVTVTIDDPDTSGVDHSAAQPVRTDNPWSSETWIDFQSPIPFKTGLIITMTDGNTFKTHTVTSLTVTEANSETDTVSGTATPGALVRVWIHDPVCCIMRHVIADEDGRWEADYSVPGDEDFENETFDLQPGNNGQASQPDEDEDATNQPWQTPRPSITVYPDDDVIEGNEWPLAASLTVQIGDPEQPDYETTATLNPADQDHSLPWFKLDLTGIYNIQPGEIATVFDATTAKQVNVANRNITSIDSLTDTITGTADPTVRQIVLWTACVNNDCAVRVKDVNPDGSWSVNFGEPGEQDWENDIVDITADTNGGIFQGDEDGDGTNYLEWRILNQPPVADAGSDQTVYVRDPVLLDASASSDPDADPLFYEWDLNNDGQYDDASSVTIATAFTQPGIYDVGLRVTDDGGLSSTDMITITVLPWSLLGFYQPVDMNGVYNFVKGGSTVPLKFEIFADPTELTDVTAVKSLTYAQVSCDANAITDPIETLTTGSTALRYDATSGQFIYNWKTPKMPGTCFRITVTTIDNSALVAYFKLK